MKRLRYDNELYRIAERVFEESEMAKIKYKDRTMIYTKNFTIEPSEWLGTNNEYKFWKGLEEEDLIEIAPTNLSSIEAVKTNNEAIANAKITIREGGCIVTLSCEVKPTTTIYITTYEQYRVIKLLEKED